MNSIDFKFKKSLQAINLFAKLEKEKTENFIDKIKALKLIWVADRLNLREYGKPIFNDIYFAMKMGPVASSTKDLISSDSTFLEDSEKIYSDLFIKLDTTGYHIESIKNPDFDVFSDSEIEILKKIYKECSIYKSSELIDISHKFPEWYKFENTLNKNHTREGMNYLDFFLNPENKTKLDDIFNQTDEKLETSKNTFIQKEEMSRFWLNV